MKRMGQTMAEFKLKSKPSIFHKRRKTITKANHRIRSLRNRILLCSQHSSPLSLSLKSKWRTRLKMSLGSLRMLLHLGRGDRIALTVRRGLLGTRSTIRRLCTFLMTHGRISQPRCANFGRSRVLTSIRLSCLSSVSSTNCSMMMQQSATNILT